MIERIISSGQTGVELAALEVAIKLGISHGGWTARGKRNTKGQLSPKYKLKEVPEVGFKTAMEKNVMHSDGTLLVTRGKKSAGTQHAVQMALPYLKNHIHQVVILCGDVPLLSAETILDLIDDHLVARRDITLLAVDVEDPEGYPKRERSY